MWLLPEWAPNLHPVLVHFPLALLLFAALMDLLSFFIPNDWWDEKKTTVTYLVGAVFTVLVFFTGQQAADAIQIPKSAYHAVGEHAGWAQWTVWFFGIYAVVRLMLSIRGSMKNKPVHMVMFAVSLIGMFLLYETGEHGAKLVFGHGLGTGNIAAEQAEVSQQKKSAVGFVSDNEGNWRWNITSNAPKALQSNFTILNKPAGGNKLSTTTRNDSTTVLVVPSDSTFIATKKQYGDFQYKLSADFSDVQGTMMVVHHMQDKANFDFMALNPGGGVALGRMENGSQSIIEEGSANWQQADSVKLVNSGEHQRGYIDGELIVHGHIEEASEGPIGLKKEGTGSLDIIKMQLSMLEQGQHGEEENSEHDEHHSH